MSIVLIGFLSIVNVKKDANGRVLQDFEKDYGCEDGIPIKGMLTNEAAIKYIRSKYPEEELRILLVESNACQKKVLDQATLQALMGKELFAMLEKKQSFLESKENEQKFPMNAEEFLKNRVDTFCREIGYKFPEFLTPIMYNDKDLSYESVLQEIMSMKEIKKEDTIILDTTGGPRDANMVLLMAAKMLTFLGYGVQEVLYANINSKKDNEKSEEKGNKKIRVPLVL